MKKSIIKSFFRAGRLFYQPSIRMNMLKSHIMAPVIIIITAIFHGPLMSQSIGDRAIGMGGAYTALADDASSAWYNPAGLVHVPNMVLNISATVYQYKSMQYNNFVEFKEPGSQGNSTASFDSKSVNFYPSTLIYAYTFKSDGFKNSLALSVLVPDSDKSRGSVVFKNRADNMKMTFSTHESYNDYFVGPSYAAGTKLFSMGTSLFVRIFDKEYTYNLFEDTKVASQSKYINARSFSEQYRNFSFIPSLGMQMNLSSTLHLGITGNYKSIPLGGKTNVQRVITTAGSENLNGTDVHSQEHVETSLDTVLKYPWKIKGGLGYTVNSLFALEISAEVSGAIKGYLDRDPLLPGSTEAEHNLYQKKMGYNFNIGGEYFLSETFQLRLGVFTLFSRHPGFGNIHTSNNNNTPAGDHYEDAVGLNLGLGHKIKDEKFSYSISIIRGEGKGLGFYTVPGYPVSTGDSLHDKTVKEIDTKFWKVAFIISGTLGNSPVIK